MPVPVVGGGIAAALARFSSVNGRDRIALARNLKPRVGAAPWLLVLVSVGSLVGPVERANADPGMKFPWDVSDNPLVQTQPPHAWGTLSTSSGLDFGKAGNPQVRVLSMFDGTVVSAGLENHGCPAPYSGKRNPTVRVRANDGSGLELWYLHLSQIWVQAGDAAPVGKVLGMSGAEGCASATHMHVELVRGGAHLSWYGRTIDGWTVSNVTQQSLRSTNVALTSSTTPGSAHPQQPQAQQPPPPAPAPPSAVQGPEPPPYSPTHAGQTVSHKGNNFRSDDGRTWIFQGSDADRARTGNPVSGVNPAGEQPPYAPSFAGQTVSWKGNNFRSDDGRTWIFQGSDAERARNPSTPPSTSAPYSAADEGAVVTDSPNFTPTSSWLLQNGQRRLIPDADTLNSVISGNGRRYYRWASAEIERIPRGSDVTSVRPLAIGSAQLLGPPAGYRVRRGDQVVLSWNPAANAARYRVSVRDRFPPNLTIVDYITDATTYVFVPPPSGFTWCVEGLPQASAEGGPSSCGWFDVDNAPPAPAAPTGLQATGLSDSTIRLTWIDNTAGQASYMIYRWNSSSWIQIASLAPGTTSYTDGGLPPGTEQTYNVAAQNAAGSTWSVQYVSAKAFQPQLRRPSAPVAPAPPPVAANPDGYHSTWTSQSPYPTLSPGETAQLSVAFRNTGTRAWLRGAPGQQANLGTNWPQDVPRPDLAWGWLSLNRLAAQSAERVDPGQVGWFAFSVLAPSVPGVYRLAVRPVIDGTTWMEDNGVYWTVTVR